jgi:nucleoside-diphosphate-sugar epimerase
MTDTALVTGGSGYVGSHVVDQLLAGGYRVHTTVRSLASPAKVRPLKLLQERYPGQLYLFEADLLKPGSFAAAMSGCGIVFHVASPFRLPEKIKDGMTEMLQPALEGTRNVLSSVDATPTVRRVVLTSTVGAIFGDYVDVLNLQQGTLDEKYFNTTSTLKTNPYHYSKVMAEKEAWQLCTAQDRWSMVAINPGLILGPSLVPDSNSGSLYLLEEMFKGHFVYGVPNLSFTTVDVREVARAHIAAAENPVAQGRYILASAEMVSFLDVSKILRGVHRRPYLLPRHLIPSWFIRAIGPFFGLTRQYLRNHLGIRFRVNNRRSIGELGINYRPIRETLVDHYRSWSEAARQRRGK